MQLQPSAPTVSPSSTRAQRSATRGMSLFELMFSIGVLATSILLVLGIFSNLVNGSQKSVDLTAGSVVADGLLSQQIYQIMSDSGTQTTFFNTSYASATAYKAGTYSLNNVIYAYKIYCQDVKMGTLHSQLTDATSSTGTTNLKRLDIVVWWNDAAAASASSASSMSVQGANAREQGLQQVHQARVLWPGGPY
jgi:hypothetical protein